MSPSSKTGSATFRGAGGGSRSGLLDLVRLFSSFDIVAFHTGGALGDGSMFRLGIGMAIFLLMSGVSVGLHSGERPLRPFLEERARRYLTPFAFWWVIYAALLTFAALRHEKAAFDWFEPNMIWQGSYYHLWFMPVALGTCVAVEALRLAARNVPTGVFVGVVLLLSPLLFHAGPALHPMVGIGVYQWVWAIPAVPISVACGRIIALPRTPRWPLAMLCFAGTLAASGLAVWYVDRDTFPLRFAVGAVLIGIGFAVSYPSNAFLYRIRTVSAGIFLCHPLVIRAVLRFIEPLPIALITAIIWVLAACLTLVLQRTRLARFAGAPPETAAPVVKERPSHAVSA